MTLTSPATVSNGTTGLLSYQNYMNKKVIKNFEPELYFYKMGKKAAYQGYKTLSRSRIARLTTTVANSTLTSGVTPSEQNLTETTATATPVQYGLFVTLTDDLVKIVPVEIVAEALELVGNNLARVVDQVIQTMLLTTGTQVIYGGTAPDRAGIDATNDKATWQLIVKWVTLLKVKSARRYTMNAYFGIFHTNVIYDLFVETTTGSFIDIAKYSMPEKIMQGEIGMIAGCRIIECPFVQTVASTVTVYPSYLMGADAFGVGELMWLTTHDTGFKDTDSDPLAQRRKVGAKVMFWSVMLRQESLVRLETASSLDSAVYAFS